MTDREIEETLAQKVMGFTLADTGYEWSPLGNDADAFMLVDALGERGIDFTLEICRCVTPKPGKYGYEVLARFGENPEWESMEGDRRRAICLAALKACGVEAERGPGGDGA